MDKEARSHSKDPVQEQLRQQKDEWNKEVSLLIAELIAFKRGMNGRGDKNFNIPPSSIKDPLPAEVNSIKDLVNSQYSKILSDSSRISSFQEDYSKNRRKSYKQASFLKENSWWGSRIKSYISLLFKLHQAERKIKWRMITSSVELYESFKVFDTHLLSKGEYIIPSSITEFTELLFEIKNEIGEKYRELFKLDKYSKDIKGDSPKGDSPKDDSSEKKQEEVKENKIQKEKKQNMSMISDSHKEKLEEIGRHIEFIPPILDDLKAKNPADAKRIGDKYDSFYKLYVNLNLFASEEHLKKDVENQEKIIDLIYADFNNFFIDLEKSYKETSLPDILKNIIQQHKINKKAGISTWFKKLLYSINPSIMEKAQLDLIDSSKEIRAKLNELMDSLEDRKNHISALSIKVQELNNACLKSLFRLNHLAELYAPYARRKERNKDYYRINIQTADFNKIKELKNYFAMLHSFINGNFNNQ